MNVNVCMFIVLCFYVSTLFDQIKKTWMLMLILILIVDLYFYVSTLLDQR